MWQRMKHGRVYLIDQVYQPAIWILQQDNGNNNKSILIIDLKFITKNKGLESRRLHFKLFTMCYM